MKVKITKTIDDNLLPAEVRRMIDQYKNVLMYTMPDKMSVIVRASLSTDGTEFFSTIKLLDDFRQELASLDENLNEVQNVLIGYKDALIPKEKHDQEWAEHEQAEYEKFMSQVSDSDSAGEVENEEG
tara:strand:- start:642 stop:1022 length:381 start_codon:yes stop_codon:yes gene_type:complete